MSILDNELVRKYFGQRPGEAIERDDSQLKHIAYMPYDWYMAYKILRSMQEPIKEGEKLLVIGTDSTINEAPAIRDHDGVHPFDLRLPDRFQKQECIVCDKTIGPLPSLCEEHQKWWNSKPTPEPKLAEDVEKKIKEIVETMMSTPVGWSGVLKVNLRELVELARKTQR